CTELQDTSRAGNDRAETLIAEERGVGGGAEAHDEGSGRPAKRLTLDRDANLMTGLARREGQSAARGRVIGRRLGGNIHRGVVDRYGLAIGVGKAYRENGGGRTASGLRYTDAI